MFHSLKLHKYVKLEKKNWTLKLSFWFSQTFNHHTHIFNFMIMLLSRIIIWLSVILWLSKCINSDVESSNCIAFFFAHVKAIFAAFFSVFTFLSIFFSSRIVLRRQCSWMTVDFQSLRESSKISIEYKLEIEWAK